MSVKCKDSTYERGPGPLMEALGFYMLFHAVSEPALFWSILIENRIEKNRVDQNLGGGGLPDAPPPGSTTAVYAVHYHIFFLKCFIDLNTLKAYIQYKYKLNKTTKKTKKEKKCSIIS